MTGLIMAAQLILGLAILVTLHELGHFLAARAFGIRVEKFYLFFDAWGFKFFSFKKGDTEYGIGWLPLGGYVKIAGMIDESMDTETLKQPAQPWEFRSKPEWQRLIVMVAGVTMNVILGIAIYAFTLLHYDQQYLANADVTDGIYVYELGAKIGLKTGDKIVALNGKPVERFDELLSGKLVFGCDLTVNRHGEIIHVTVPDDFYHQVTQTGKGNFMGCDNFVIRIDSLASGGPAEHAGLRSTDKIVSINNDSISLWGELRSVVRKNKGKPVTIGVIREDHSSQTLAATIDTTGMIGIYVKNPYAKTDYSFGHALRFGTSDAFEAIVSNLKGLKRIFTGHEKASDSLQGPIGIAAIYGGIWDWRRFWTITGLLSMILAFMNILPIPALDGGHMIFLSIESISRKKFSDKFMERAQIVGMVIILALMVFSIGNDIWKHVIN
jgi:regulator of sigma E protease